MSVLHLELSLLLDPLAVVLPTPTTLLCLSMSAFANAPALPALVPNLGQTMKLALASAPSLVAQDNKTRGSGLVLMMPQLAVLLSALAPAHLSIVMASQCPLLRLIASKSPLFRRTMVILALVFVILPSRTAQETTSLPTTHNVVADAQQTLSKPSATG